MRIAVTTTQIPFWRDDAFARAEDLVRALRRAGHEAEMVSIPFSGRPDCGLPDQMLACRLLDLEESMGTRIDRLIALAFPAYLVPHSAKVIWLLQPCRDAYGQWDLGRGSLHAAPHGEQLRRLVRDADARLIPRARRVFVPSRHAAEQLRADCGATASLLQAPPSYAERYQRGAEADFFLIAMSSNGPQRIELILEAMRHTHHPVRLHVIADMSGLPPEALDGRVTCAKAEADERRTLFGSCIAAINVPFGEMDDTVTLEAMLSESPVVTCRDSGATVELVHNGHTGFVCAPDAEALADILDRLWEDRALARRLGRAARSNYQDLHLSWETVVERLLAWP